MKTTLENLKDSMITIKDQQNLFGGTDQTTKPPDDDDNVDGVTVFRRALLD